MRTGERGRSVPSDNGRIRPDQPTPDNDTAQNQAYSFLKQKVFDGYFMPGDVVTLRSLCELSSIGVMPIREAIRRLVSDGAFVARPNRSAQVPHLRRHDVEQIIELRLELEGRAAAQAAENITARHLAELHGLQKLIDQYIETDQPARISAVNHAFHFKIYEIAENEPLYRLIEALWLRMAPVIAWSAASMALNREERTLVAQSHHVGVLEAFHRRDGELAKAEMQADIRGPTKMRNYWPALDSLAR